MKEPFPNDSKISAERVRLAQRHLFLCVGPDCCDPAAGDSTWQSLKKQLIELGIPVLRTKAACLRVCRGGPWLVVEPDGVWYGGVTPARLERILAEHVVGGTAVDEWAAARRERSAAIEVERRT